MHTGNMTIFAIIANSFNEFFASNFTVSNNPESPDTWCQGHRDPLFLTGVKTDSHEIFKIIKSLKNGKAPGPDGITSTMLKHTAAQVAFPLSLIFNISLDEGKVPDDWKRANVVPIHKAGNIACIKNYRPISLCSVVGKMLERVVTRNVVEYMKTSGLISAQQHGFMTGCSCTTLLTKVCHHWTQLMDKRSPPDIDVIFLDWSKAFDKVSHSILLGKLHQYGICGSLWHWISSFLLDRFQCVKFRGASSGWVPVKSGVPQGSVLGPLLFNIFVLDLPNYVKSPLPQYADDTLLYRPIHSEDDINIIQNDLNNIDKWCNDNKMALNADKCKTMRLTRRNNADKPSYSIHGKPLGVVQNYKYLGIMISSDLNWGDHVKFIASRASRLLGFIRRLVRCNDPQILINLFSTLCRPILEYGIPAWLPYQTGHCDTLEKIQKRLARACIPSPRGQIEYSTRLEKLDLMSLCNRYKYLSISFVSKCLYGKYVDPFGYISVNSNHTDTLKFFHQYARTDSYKYNVFNRFPVYFDQLPKDIRDQLLFNISGFLLNCKDHFKHHSWK